MLAAGEGTPEAGFALHGQPEVARALLQIAQLFAGSDPHHFLERRALAFKRLVADRSHRS